MAGKAFVRTGEAVWKGSGRDGSGTLTTETHVLDKAPYSAGTRFGDDKGTNPEELLAVAHAGCFSMALAFGLQGKGKTVEELHTKAIVTIAQDAAGFTITGVKLDLEAKVPGMTAEEFEKAAQDAKAGCPVSRLFSGAPITLDAKLIG